MRLPGQQLMQTPPGLFLKVFVARHVDGRSRLGLNGRWGLGKASGQEVLPADRLGAFYSTLEEARADLIALYWISHPKLVEMGQIDGPDMALAEYESFTSASAVPARNPASMVAVASSSS